MYVEFLLKRRWQPIKISPVSSPNVQSSCDLQTQKIPKLYVQQTLHKVFPNYNQCFKVMPSRKDTSETTCLPQQYAGIALTCHSSVKILHKTIKSTQNGDTTRSHWAHTSQTLVVQPSPILQKNGTQFFF